MGLVRARVSWAYCDGEEGEEDAEEHGAGGDERGWEARGNGAKCGADAGRRL